MSVANARTTVNLCQEGTLQHKHHWSGLSHYLHTDKSYIDVKLTPFLSTDFPDSSVSAIAVLGFTFSNNNSTLCHYCSTRFCLHFGHEITEHISGLQLGFTYRFHVADSALSFKKFCMQYIQDTIKRCPGLNVDIWCFDCAATSTKLVHLMESAAVIIGCRNVIIKMIIPHERLHCLSTCRLDYGRCVITNWWHDAPGSLYKLKDLSEDSSSHTDYWLDSFSAETTAANLSSC